MGTDVHARQVGEKVQGLQGGEGRNHVKCTNFQKPHFWEWRLIECFQFCQAGQSADALALLQRPASALARNAGIDWVADCWILLVQVVWVPILEPHQCMRKYCIVLSTRYRYSQPSCE